MMLYVSLRKTLSLALIFSLSASTFPVTTPSRAQTAPANAPSIVSDAAPDAAIDAYISALEDYHTERAKREAERGIEPKPWALDGETPAPSLAQSLDSLDEEPALEALLALLFTQRLEEVTTAFAHAHAGKNPTSYTQGLQHLNAKFRAYENELQGPEAERSSRILNGLYDLALRLQLDWEAQYGPLFAPDLQNYAHRGRKIGFVTGTVAMTLLTLRAAKNPAAVPTLLRVARFTLPAAGSVAGIYAGQAAAHLKHGIDRSIPPAPAHILEFVTDAGRFAHDPTLEELNDIIAESIVDLAVITATMAAIDAVVAASVAASTTAVRVAAAGVGLIAGLAIGMIASYYVAQEVKSAIRANKKAEFAREIQSGAQALLNASHTASTLRAADALERATMTYAYFINRDLIDAQNTFQREVAEAVLRCIERFPERPEFKDDSSQCIEFSAETQKEINRSTEKMAKFAHDFLDQSRYQYHAEYEGALVRAFLLALPSDAPITPDAILPLLAQFSPTGRELARTYIEDWRQCFSRTDSQQCAYAFSDYIEALNRAEDRRIARELLAHGPRDHAGHAYLQAAALIRSKNNPAIRFQADRLMGWIFKNDLQIRETTGRTFTNAKTGAQK